MRPESRRYLHDIAQACEAIGQATRIDEELGGQIEDAREIINLRNVIVHGYTIVQNETVWGIVQTDVPKLQDEVARLLA